MSTKEYSLIKEYNLVMVDSRNRQISDGIVYGDLKSLPPYPLVFYHNSNRIDILTEGLNMNLIGKQIVLKNISSKSILLKDPLSVKKGSQYVRVRHQRHGLSLYEIFDSDDSIYFESVIGVDYLSPNSNSYGQISDSQNYYVLRNPGNLRVKLSNVTSNNNDFPVSYLNGVHEIYLLFTLKGSEYYPDPDSYLIRLEKKSKINYTMSKPENSGNILASFLDLYGVPLDKIVDTPLTVINQTLNTLTVETNYNAIVDPMIDFYDRNDLYEYSSLEINENNRGGGNQVYLQEVIQIKTGYPNPSNYVIQLNKIYENISNIKVTSTNFKNTIPNVRFNRNTLYWRNLSDGNRVYQLQIPPGYYDSQRLATEIQSAFNRTPRSINTEIHTQSMNSDYNLYGEYKYHLTQVQIDQIGNTSISFKNRKLLFDTEERSIIQIPEERLLLSSKTVDPWIILHDGLVYTQITNSSYILNFDIRVYVELTSQNFIYDVIGCNVNRTDSDSITKTVYFNDRSIIRVGDYYVTDIFSDVDSGLIYQVKSIWSNSLQLEMVNTIQPILVENLLINKNSYRKINYGVDIDSISPLNKLNRTAIIYHSGHNLETGNVITINNSKNIDNVPASVINSDHRIKVISPDYYIIQLPLYNQLEVFYEDYNTITIDYPDYAQLLFDRTDTLGSILRFPNMGDPNAITPFRQIIRNTDPYQIPIPPVFTPSYDYFYICISGVASNIQNAPFSDAIAIVRLIGPYGTPLVDTFVRNSFESNTKKFNKSELEIRMLYPDGTLVDFADSEHFFTLEIEQIRRNFS